MGKGQVSKGIPKSLYPFTLAAVTNNHEFGGLKQKQLMPSQSGIQKSEVSVSGLKSRYGRAMLSLEALVDSLFLASSSFWWLWASLGLWGSHHSSLCFHGHSDFSSSVCVCVSDVHLPFSYTDTCDYI